MTLKDLRYLIEKLYGLALDEDCNVEVVFRSSEINLPDDFDDLVSSLRYKYVKSRNALRIDITRLID